MPAVCGGDGDGADADSDNGGAGRVKCEVAYDPPMGLLEISAGT